MVMRHGLSFVVWANNAALKCEFIMAFIKKNCVGSLITKTDSSLILILHLVLAIKEEHNEKSNPCGNGKT